MGQRKSELDTIVIKNLGSSPKSSEYFTVLYLKNGLEPILPYPSECPNTRLQIHTLLYPIYYYYYVESGIVKTEGNENISLVAKTHF